jgi:hypothetical protein
VTQEKARCGATCSQQQVRWAACLAAAVTFGAGPWCCWCCGARSIHGARRGASARLGRVRGETNHPARVALPPALRRATRRPPHAFALDYFCASAPPTQRAAASFDACTPRSLWVSSPLLFGCGDVSPALSLRRGVGGCVPPGSRPNCFCTESDRFKACDRQPKINH